MTLLNRSGSDSQPVITTRVGRFMAWCRHSTGEAVLLRTVAHRSHPEQVDVVHYEHGENFLFEAVVKCVHDVERHPHGRRTGARRPCPTSLDEYPDSPEARSM